MLNVILPSYRKICLPLCFLFVASLAAARPSIEVNGNERTKTSYIEKLIDICFAKIERESTPSQDMEKQELEYRIRQCLVNAGLFSSVSVIAEEKILVTVQEKINRIILPTYRSSQVMDDVFWGGLVFDANTGGRGQPIGLLYTRQQEQGRDSFSFFYDIPYVDRSGKHGFTLIGYHRDTDFLSYTGERWNYKTREVFRFLWLRGAYYLLPDLELRYGYAPSILRYTDSVNRDDPRETAVDSDVDIQSVNLGIFWDSTNRKYFYDHGTRIEATHHQQISRNDDEESSAAFFMEIYQGIPLAPLHLFTVQIAGGTRNIVNEVDNLRIGDEPGSRGIPEHGAWNRQYLTVGLDYQFSILSGGLGYWTIGPFADYGYQWQVFHRPEEDLSYNSVGFSSFLHLLNVNFPAVGLFYSSNNRYHKDFVSFYIGVRV